VIGLCIIIKNQSFTKVGRISEFGVCGGIRQLLKYLNHKEVSLPEGLPNAASGFSDESNILSFIIRIWREEIDMDMSEGIWRGHITLIPSGERQYFADINQIPALIASHLNKNR
jgi:hypothetical protein